MKREAHTHPKILEFIDWIDEQIGDGLRAAGVSAAAVGTGLLERLWNLAAEHAIRGDIGQFTNDRIARVVGWRGGPDAFVAALVRIGLVDEDPEFRLVIHNWPTHCGEFIHARLARGKMTFADGSEPSIRKLTREERQRLESGAAGRPTAASGRQRTPSAAAGRQRQPTARSHSHSHSQSQSQSQEAAAQARGAAAAAADEQSSGFTFVLSSGSDLFDLPQSQVDAWRSQFPDVHVAEILARLADWTADQRPSMGRRRIIGFLAEKLAEEATVPPKPATTRKGSAGKPEAGGNSHRPRMVNGEDLTEEEMWEGVPDWLRDRERADRERRAAMAAATPELGNDDLPGP